MRSRARGGSPAFTIIEIMLAIGIFAMVLTAIYATWTAILRGSKAGMTAAAAVQRARITIRALEDALLTVRMYAENRNWYSFVADTKGDMASLSMVCRLPSSFPGVGRYGDQIVRRVNFFVRGGANGQNELVMTQIPMLSANEATAEPYSLVLAKDVSLFLLDFWDQRANEWATDWKQTNQLPKLVRVSLGLGSTKGSSQPQDVVTRIVAIPSLVIGREIQMPLGAPGPGVPPNTLPNADPGFVPPPGGQPPVNRLPPQQGGSPPRNRVKQF